MTDKDKLKMTALKSLQTHRGWTDYLKPWLEEKITANNSLKKIDFKKDNLQLASEIRAQRAKIDVYQSVINYFDIQIKSLEEEEKNVTSK